MPNRQKQIDRIIHGLHVIMAANPNNDLIDVLTQICIKSSTPNLMMLDDNTIEETIDEIFIDLENET